MATRELRPYQREAIAAVHEHWQEWDKELLVMGTGCHTPEQGILMFDGTVKRADEVKVGDLLMGPDGTKRTVLALYSGENEMYRVTPIKGSPFIVTENHILPLVETARRPSANCPSMVGGRINLVRAGDYNSQNKLFKHINKLYRASAIKTFGCNDGEDLPIDPHLLGILLGDGSLHGVPNVTTMDDEVRDEVEFFTSWYKGWNVKQESGKADTISMSGCGELRAELKKLGLWGLRSGEKFVPFEYKTAPIGIRLRVIAGLLDSDGSLTTGGYDYISKSRNLSEDLAFMCRSVGLAAYVKKCHKGYEGFTSEYWRVSISGDCSVIPCDVEHKKAPIRRQKKSVLRTGIKSCEHIGRGSYAGFEVDGDHLYLLDDFTVTHNTGKTYTAHCIIQNRLNNGSVLFLAHRDELIEQARSTFGDAGKIKGSECDIRPITVGSVQTLVNRPRYEGFKTLIIDEAHHAVSDSYQKVMAQYQDAKVLGLTATPDRKGLGNVFEGIAYEYGLRDAVKDGYLSPIVARTIPIDIDLTKVKTRVGDFEITGLVEALEPYLPEIAKSMVEHAMDRKTIVFLPLVKMAQEFAEMLRGYGFDAREVDGASPDRKEKLDWFSQAGKGAVMCNAMLLTEGYDCPDVDCVVVLRPTKVRSLYSQMVGRGTRLAPNKDNCLILDFLWLSTRHDLCRPASLITANDEDAEKVSEKAVDEELELFDALTDVEEQRRNALAEAIRANAKRKARLVDPLTFFVDVNEVALLDYQPEWPWEREAPTEKQIRLIEGAGVNTDGMCRGQASKVIDAIFRRRDAKLATPKQMRMLQNKGFQNVGLWTFEQASDMMGRLAKNRWRVPWGIDPKTYVPR